MFISQREAHSSCSIYEVANKGTNTNPDYMQMLTNLEGSFEGKWNHWKKKSEDTNLDWLRQNTSEAIESPSLVTQLQNTIDAIDLAVGQHFVPNVQQPYHMAFR